MLLAQAAHVQAAPDAAESHRTPMFTPAEAAALRKAAGTASSSAVTWLPAYGCAVLAIGMADPQQDMRCPLDQISLVVLGLDSWRWKLHASRCVGVGGAGCPAPLPLTP